MAIRIIIQLVQFRNYRFVSLVDVCSILEQQSRADDNVLVLLVLTVPVPLDALGQGRLGVRPR